MQASCSYLEAEAAVLLLKSSHDALTPFDETAKVDTDTDPSVRRLASGPAELRATYKHALHHGMQRGLEGVEAWAVLNGAVIAWNTQLPAIRQGQFAPAQSLLQVVLQQLLRLPAADQNTRLLCDLAVATLQSCEHAHLLESGTAQAGSDLAAVRANYAQHGGISASTEASSARTALQAAVPLADAALKLLANAPCQSLIEQYARTRQLLGMSTDVAGVVSASQQSTAQVCLMSRECPLQP